MGRDLPCPRCGVWSYTYGVYGECKQGTNCVEKEPKGAYEQTKPAPKHEEKVMSKHVPTSPVRTHSQQGTPGRIVGPGAPATPAPKGAVDWTKCTRTIEGFPVRDLRVDEDGDIAGICTTSGGGDVSAYWRASDGWLIASVSHQSCSLDASTAHRGAPPQTAEPAKAAACEGQLAADGNYYGLYGKEWRVHDKKAPLHARPVPQPIPFAVGEHVEWVGCGESAIVEILGLDPVSKDAWLRNLQTKRRFSHPQSTLRRPPAKRVVTVTVREFMHYGQRMWTDADKGEKFTGRSHEFTVEGEE